MGVGEILDRIREYYLSRLREALREHRKATSEPSLCNKEGSVVREGDLNLPIRVDLYTGDAFQRIDTQKYLTFDPVTFLWEESLEVRLEPFKWNDLRVTLKTSEGPVSWKPLVAWFEKWFDEEDSRPEGSDGLHGVAHFLSDPIKQADGYELSADLGSAPVEAFEELLDAVRVMGVRTMSIGI